MMIRMTSRQHNNMIVCSMEQHFLNVAFFGGIFLDSQWANLVCLHNTAKVRRFCFPPVTPLKQQRCYTKKQMTSSHFQLLLILPFHFTSNTKGNNLETSRKSLCVATDCLFWTSLHFFIRAHRVFGVWKNYMNFSSIMGILDYFIIKNTVENLFWLTITNCLHIFIV